VLLVADLVVDPPVHVTDTVAVYVPLAFLTTLPNDGSLDPSKVASTNSAKAPIDLYVVFMLTSYGQGFGGE
jgi:hypothetical protein